jgi:hypothetical protein
MQDGRDTGKPTLRSRISCDPKFIEKLNVKSDRLLAQPDPQSPAGQSGESAHGASGSRLPPDN